MFRFLLTLGMLACLMLGCAKEESVFHEVKRPHEVLTLNEVNQYLRAMHELRSLRPPAFPPLLATVPDWSFDRELSVRRLVSEQEKLQESRWQPADLLERLSSEKRLHKVLDKQGLSPAQFLGLAESLSLAASRTHIRDEAELKEILRVGQYQVNLLKKHGEVFASLPESEQHELLQKAIWIARVDRAKSLLSVPEENIAFVKKHWKALEPYLHPEALKHPLEGISDLREHYGLPFEELSETGSDAQLRWSPRDSEALIGHDSLGAKSP